MIVIPAAGEGKRFKEAGYQGPKHLLPLNGKTMIEYVISNVRPLDPESGVFIVTQAQVGKTRGAVETILKAAYNIPREDVLVVANCDQLVLLPQQPVMRGDGVIFTFRSANPAHSYVVTEGDFILDIVEKPEKPPTDRAVSGVYWFRRAASFLDACEQVEGDGELYVSEALGIMLGEGYSLYAQDAPTAILGTPEDFSRFEVAVALCAS